MKQTLCNRGRLSRSISFRLSDADYTRLAYQAATANLRINELARQRTLANVSELTIETHRRHDPALVTQLIAIGNNLNQMAKRLYITGRVSPYLEKLCKRIERIIDDAIDNDGGA